MMGPVPVVTNAYAPRETIELCGRMGVAKANTRIDKVFVSSVLAGVLLSFAGAVLLTVNASPWFEGDAPGMLKIAGGLLFPIGFVMVVTSGTDLCTGSFVITTLAVLQRRISVWKMLLHWFITFWGNLAGSLFVVAIIAGYGGVVLEQSAKDAVYKF
ncbi:putative formate/nitrite transporter, aquaporin [Septoria linicola]|nr:putative formate/nitrite transporter, aquaporin [Septoria linicola]